LGLDCWRAGVLGVKGAGASASLGY
jgi:hypothetical protein